MVWAKLPAAELVRGLKNHQKGVSASKDGIPAHDWAIHLALQSRALRSVSRNRSVRSLGPPRIRIIPARPRLFAPTAFPGPQTDHKAQARANFWGGLVPSQHDVSLSEADRSQKEPRSPGAPVDCILSAIWWGGRGIYSAICWSDISRILAGHVERWVSGVSIRRTSSRARRRRSGCRRWTIRPLLTSVFASASSIT